jgi:sporulation protein YlmC with PRC-barrel domain
MKILSAAAIISIAMIATSSWAQTTQAPAPTPPPAASPRTNPPSAAQPQWYTHRADEMRASKLIGNSVKNEANETIGSINEIVLGKDGKVAAVIVGVGGFLGIGEREVAVNFDSLKLSRDTSNNLVVMMNATKDSLKAAPAWTWSNERAGPTPGGAPATRPAIPDSTRK